MGTKTGSSVLRYEEVASILRKQIASGDLRPGDRLPSYARMQQEYGAATYTVDKIHAVLENDGLIVRRHRRGVYVSDPRLRTRTGVLGVYFHLGAEQHPYYTHIGQGIREVADKRGRELLFLNREGPDAWDRLDGVLMCESNFTELGWQVPPGVPAIGLMRALPGFGSVNIDNREAAATTTRHLVELGHRKIAYLAVIPAPTNELLTERYAGYLQALKAAGIRPRGEWTRDLREYRNGRLQVRSFFALGHERMTEWLGDGWSETGCTAVLAHNDDAAVGIVKALREAGLRVPEDISVVGFDGTEVAQYSHPTLTTMRVPLIEIGARGAEMLIEQVEAAGAESSNNPSPIVLPARLMKGESTGPAPTAKK